MSDSTPTSPQQAIEKLQQGNARFLQQLSDPTARPRQLTSNSIEELATGQHPWAVVLGCADSRVPVEQIFDCVSGELFVVRVAGNIAHASQIGSIEFAVANFPPRLILVLGHSSCGAVKAALTTEVSDIESASLASVVASIKPALAGLPAGPDLEAAATEANVRQTMQALEESSVIAAAQGNNTLAIAGAVYQLSSGAVTFI